MRRFRGELKRLLLGSRTGPPPGTVRWSDLRRTAPISRSFGYDRGTPVDRYYIEDFLSRWSNDVAGRVLEVKDPTYTHRFGGERVSRSDVLDIDAANPHATIVTDLNSARELPSDAFDCIILTQTLQLVYELRSAIESLHRSLKPGGVLLATVPGITPLSHRKLGHTWYWSFTGRVMERLIGERFPASGVWVEAYGNVLSATALLYGLCCEELRLEELRAQDPDYPVTIAVRAVKQALS